ncbi:PKD-like family lipoprotein [Flavobacterium luteolum]|uniref:PKD-like family lipoprotein n=1 Tax=Flavobacterium luteolum TaxID=3003259 RepID=UPI00248ED41F|nr:PKD-like family lipoprotein [Flavobacterium luteolum]
MASCQTDDQDFSYDPTNEISVVTDTTSYSVIQFETLNIVPEISNSIKDDRTYKYEWSAYATLSGKTPVVLSTEKDLNEPIGLDVNTYHLVYSITDTKTGVVYTQRYTLKVDSGFYEGWLVANNKDGRGQLSFIRKDGLVIYNPAEEVNGKTYSGMAFDAAAPINDLTDNHQIYYFASDNIYLFDANSFTELSTSEKLFGLPLVSSAPADVAIGSLSSTAYIVNNGKIHSTSMFAGFEGAYTAPLTGDYDSVYPMAFVNQSFNAYFGNTYFYDNIRKKFVFAAMGEVRINAAAATASNAFFNMASVNRTMLVAAKGTAGRYHFIMKDDSTSKCYLYSLNNGIPSANKEIALAGIDQITSFDAISSGAELAYIGLGNKLYKYDIAANTTVEIYEFPATAKIADIKTYKNPYLDFSINPTDPQHNKKITVAVNNGGSGEVFVFSLSGTGTIVNSTFSEHYTGFGEIKSVAYRNK